MSGWFKKSGSQPDPSSDDRDEGSAPESAAVFLRGLEEHLTARAELLGLEAREAGQLAARKAMLGLAVASLLIIAYALLLVALVSLCGTWLSTTWPQTFGKTGWQLVALLAGLLHFLLALVLFSKLKRQPEQSLFEFTRAEFQKDRQWLHQKKNQSGNGSGSSR